MSGIVDEEESLGPIGSRVLDSKSMLCPEFRQIVQREIPNFQRFIIIHLRFSSTALHTKAVMINCA